MRRRLLLGGVVAAVLLVGGYTLVHVMAAARAGERGRAALTQAESSLSGRDLDAARQHLTAAQDAFLATRSEIGALGPLASAARRVPVLGKQVRAVDTFASVGVSLSGAAQGLVEAADTIIHPPDDQLPISAAMDALRSTHRLLGPASATISQAADQVSRLEDWFLIGPLARARDDLTTRLPRIQARATSADHGLAALMAFAGDTGPRRYLFLSQNPDEVRPTGGFIGTYGVLTAEAGQMKLERYDAIENWVASRPQADVPPERVGPPYQYHDPPLRRTMANVNTGPNWPQAAELATSLWKAGGEAPVDGVISFTPGFMGRILAVVGPVTVPAYDDTVTAQNINERLDFHTHQAKPAVGTGRKDFVAALAEIVMRKLLDAPASQWEPLGRAMGEAFDAREAVAWSTDPAVASVLAERRWDGALPAHDGDFFFNSEFEYAAKNGRGIRRAYDHHVAVNAQGDARVTTKLTITNTEPSDPNGNASTLAYLTIYGPEGAVLDPAASDAFSFKEPAVAGHPAAGWFKAAAPAGGQTTLTVVWDVPGLLNRLDENSMEYSLRWRNLPDHTGDVVNLSVELPPGWAWSGSPPPAQFSLDREIVGSWRLTSSS
ncbi:MAG: DUF4012 domain-containing protein [Acidimicrobiales bacterium]